MPSAGLRNLQTLSKRACKENRESVFDIVLFGSFIKEKFRPEDIDLCIIFTRKIGQDEIRRISGSFKGCHVEHLFLNEIYKEPLWSTLIHEGYSLTENRFLHEILGFKSYMLFTYSLKRLPPVRKSMFSHALFGRERTGGILKEVKGKTLGRGCIIVPVENSERAREFLETWKIDYSVTKAFLG
jgi:predicted nucleotidyltransferase